MQVEINDLTVKIDELQECFLVDLITKKFDNIIAMIKMKCCIFVKIYQNKT